MITLENKNLAIKINEKGAELTSVLERRTQYEFLWQANPEYWGRHAPVLFPIVGRLKENQYQYKGHHYEMSQHGFARDSMFEVVQTTPESVLFKLESTKETKQKYPFDFELYIQYTLKENKVVTKYKVINLSNTNEMYYAIGGHPAFNVSQTTNEDGKVEYNQVSVEIKPETTVTHFPLTQDGLIKKKEAKSITPNEITLSYETFRNDALIFEIGDGRTIELIDKSNDVQISMQTSNLPFVGIWSPYPKRASFVCIEPWAGIADVEDTTGDFKEKMGINHLNPSEEMSHEYTALFVIK